MDFGYLIAIALSLFCIYEIKDHNNKVEQLFPDPADQKQFNMRSELKISLVGHGLLLIALIAYFLSSFFRG